MTNYGMGGGGVLVEGHPTPDIPGDCPGLTGEGFGGGSWGGNGPGLPGVILFDFERE